MTVSKKKGNKQGQFGGVDNKKGLKYEIDWTIYCFLKILREEASSILLEPPGEAKGIEFLLFFPDGSKEHHQVKKRDGVWYLSDLKNKGVLDASAKAADKNDRFVFVSYTQRSQLVLLENRAHDVAPFTLFQETQLGDNLYKEIDNLRNASNWKCSRKKAYNRLRKIDFRTEPKERLKESNLLAIELLFSGDPQTVHNDLTDLIFEQDGVTVDAHDLWTYLEKRKHKKQILRDDPSLRKLLDQQNDLVLGFTSATRNFDPIERSEVQELIHEFDGKECKTIVFAGPGGMGKTEVLRQVVEEIKDDIPVLIFRADHLEYTPSSSQLGEQLGLPSSPEIALKRYAGERPTVLIIDQLDNISSSTGRDSRLWVPIKQIIDRATGIAGMQILLCGRKTEFDEDPQLKQITKTAKIIELGGLSSDQIKSALGDLQIPQVRIDNLPEALMNVLSSPFNLNLLAGLWQESEAFREAWPSDESELLKQFWKSKQENIGTRKDEPTGWFVPYVDKICQAMAKGHKLVLPKIHYLVLNKNEHLMALVSESILIETAQGYAFAHQSFFDSAQVQVMLGSDLSFLKQAGPKNDQRLFHVAQIRNYLRILRASEQPKYFCELKELLESDQLRGLLRRAIYTLLLFLPDPTWDEFLIMQPTLLNSENPEYGHTLKLLDQAPWANLLDAHQQIEQWLNGDEHQINLGLRPLSAPWKLSPQRVAELLQPKVENSQEWRNRLRWVFWGKEVSVDDSLFQLLLRCVELEELSEKGHFQLLQNIGIYLSFIEKQDAAKACELLGTVLRYFSVRMINNQTWSGSDKFDQTFDHMTLKMDEWAEQSPKAFLEFLFKPVLNLTSSQKSDYSKQGELYHDSFWQMSYSGLGHDRSHKLLLGLESALSQLLQISDPDFDMWRDQLIESGSFSLRLVLLRSYSVAPDSRSDEAMEFLIQNFEMLELSAQADAGFAEILKRMALSCSLGKIQSIEQLLFYLKDTWYGPSDYYFKNSVSLFKQWQNSDSRRRYLRCLLLDAIPWVRLSRAAQVHLKMLKRQGYGDEQQSNRRKWFGSNQRSLKAEDIEKLPDRHLLGLVQKHGLRVDPGEWGDTRAEILSSAFRDIVKKEPTRYTKLALQIPEDLSPPYLTSVIEGLCNLTEPFDEELVWEVCRQAIKCNAPHSVPRICRLLSKFSKNEPPNDLVEWLRSEISTSPLPRAELQAELNQYDEIENTLKYRIRMFVTLGIKKLKRSNQEEVGFDFSYPDSNSNSGKEPQKDPLGEAILQNISENREQWEAFAKISSCQDEVFKVFRTHLDNCMFDPRPSVRSKIARVLLYVMHLDRAWSVKTLLRLSTGSHYFLASFGMRDFICNSTEEQLRRMSPLIDKMLRSSIKEVQKHGVLCLGFLSMSEGKIDERIHKLIDPKTADIGHRLGLAMVVSDHMKFPENLWLGEALLPKLFDDPELEVRNSCRSWRYAITGKNYWSFQPIINSYMGSTAFDDQERQWDDLLEDCLKADYRNPQWLLDLANRTLDVTTDEHSGAPSRCVQLAMKLYNLPNQPELQPDCLDLLDRVALEFPFQEVQDEIGKIELES